MCRRENNKLACRGYHYRLASVQSNDLNWRREKCKCLFLCLFSLRNLNCFHPISYYACPFSLLYLHSVPLALIWNIFLPLTTLFSSNLDDTLRYFTFLPKEWFILEFTRTREKLDVGDAFVTLKSYRVEECYLQQNQTFYTPWKKMMLCISKKGSKVSQHAFGNLVT